MALHHLSLDLYLHRRRTKDLAVSVTSFTLTVKRQDGKGPNSPHWRGDDIAYRTAHDRVVKQRGKASQYCYVDCGKPAKHWSYNLTDPQELSGPGRGNGSTQRWSVDPAHYEPRCHSCHLTFGHSARRRQTRERAQERYRKLRRRAG